MSKSTRAFGSEEAAGLAGAAFVVGAGLMTPPDSTSSNASAITTSTSRMSQIIRLWQGIPNVICVQKRFSGFEAEALRDETIGLILEEFGPTANQAAALDAILFTRDPFPVVNSQNHLANVADPNTRVMVFITNLQLLQGEPPSVVTVNLVDSNNQSYNIPAENVVAVPNNTFTQVIFRLPDSLPPGTCTIKVMAHSQESNVGTIRIRL